MVQLSNQFNPNQNLNQSIALIESIDGRVKALLGSTDNPSDELLAFAKKMGGKVQTEFRMGGKVDISNFKGQF